MTYEMDILTVKGKEYDVQWHWDIDGLTIDEVYDEEARLITKQDDPELYVLLEEVIEEQVEDEDVYCSDCDKNKCTCDRDYERSIDA